MNKAHLALVLCSSFLLTACDNTVTGMLSGSRKEVVALVGRVEGGDTDALPRLQTLAEKHDPYAAFGVGYLLQTGQGGVIPNGQKALAYYEFAKKLPEANYNSGLIYLKGMPGAPRNPQQSVRYFMAAAGEGKNGLGAAAYQLAMLNDSGLIPNASSQKALYWYEKAANNGVAAAMYRTGLLYANGSSEVAKDPIQARMWLQRAAEQWQPDAMAALAKINCEGNDLERDVVTGLKWAMIAADVKPKYQELVSKYSADVRDVLIAQARDSARVWLKSHQRRSSLVDLDKPIPLGGAA